MALFRNYSDANTTAKIGDIIAAYINDSRKSFFWDSVGWWINVSPLGFLHASDGMCYGMALSSASNFNRRADSTTGWGVSTGDFNAVEWKTAIDNHWDSDASEAKTPYRPYSVDNIYAEYGANDYQALEKIMYYHVAQPYLDQKTYWVGKDEGTCAPYETDLNSYIYPTLFILKNGEVAPLSIFFDDDSGHTILVTQIINTDKMIKLVTYDNNKPSVYSTWAFEKKNGRYSFSNIEYLSNKKIYYYLKDGTFNALKKVCYLTEEPLHSFKTIESKKSVASRAAQDNNTTESVDYQFPNHIEVYLVGGTFKGVKTADGKDIALYPLPANLDKDTAYRSEQNVFRNKVFLPANQQYRISIKKNTGFPIFKAFVTVPNDNGTVELLTYTNIVPSEQSDGYATIFVGKNNTKKSIMRCSASPISPDSDNVYQWKLSPASSMQAVVLDSGVSLAWSNPKNNPNYLETVIVRKENSIPKTVTDGTEVYRGTDESFLDDTITKGKAYYYAAFALDKDSNAAEPSWVYVDTYRYTLYGYVKDQNGNGISGAVVTLYTGAKSKIIGTTSTNKNGLFAFNELLDGNYILDFSQAFYKFDNSEVNVAISEKSKEVDVTAQGIPALFMDIPQNVTEGDTVKIVWSGKHTNGSEKVTVKLFYNNKWTTIASDIPLSQGSYNWKIGVPKENKTTGNNETGKIRVELSGNPSVGAEKDIVITAATTNGTTTNSSGSSGGGGCTIGGSNYTDFSFPLFLLLSVLYLFKKSKQDIKTKTTGAQH